MQHSKNIFLLIFNKLFRFINRSNELSFECLNEMAFKRSFFF